MNKTEEGVITTEMIIFNQNHDHNNKKNINLNIKNINNNNIIKIIIIILQNLMFFNFIFSFL